MLRFIGQQSDQSTTSTVIIPDFINHIQTLTALSLVGADTQHTDRQTDTHRDREAIKETHIYTYTHKTSLEVKWGAERSLRILRLVTLSITHSKPQSVSQSLTVTHLSPK